MRSREIFERPKLLTRQAADRIIAACDEEGFYYYSNTLHGSTPKPGTNPWYLLAALNSSAVNFYYRATSDERGRNFAQVKLTLLKRLPIPVLTTDLQQEIGALARLQSRCFELEREQQINRLIYPALQISFDEQELMNQYL